ALARRDTGAAAQARRADVQRVVGDLWSGGREADDPARRASVGLHHRADRRRVEEAAAGILSSIIPNRRNSSPVSIDSPPAIPAACRERDRPLKGRRGNVLAGGWTA